MKNYLLVLILVVLLAGAGIFIFTRDDDNDSSDTGNQSQTQEDASQQIADADPDAAHLDGANEGATLDATAQTDVTVTMTDFKYDPQILKVRKGATVTWQNNGPAGHDVTPASNSPQQFEGSELLAKGEKYSFTFNETGKYYYFCSPHASQMRAIIEVVE